MKKSYRKFIYIAVFLFIIFLIFKIKSIREIFYLILISFIISYILKPVMDKMIARFKIKKRAAAFFVISIIFIAFFGIIFLVVPNLLKESLNVEGTAKIIEKSFANIESKIKILKGNRIFGDIADNINKKLNYFLIKSSNKFFNLFLELFQNVFDLFVIPILSYYFLADSDKLDRFFIFLFPCEFRNIVRKIKEDVDKVLLKYILSQIFLSIIIGACTFVILIFYGIQFPLLLSVLNAFFNIIPYFGPIIGAIPIILVAFLKSKKAVLYVAIWLNVIQQIEGNIICPKLTGSSIDMHPLLVIILITIGEKIGGVAGMIFAIPVGIIVRVIYEDINYYLF